MGYFHNLKYRLIYSEMSTSNFNIYDNRNLLGVVGSTYRPHTALNSSIYDTSIYDGLLGYGLNRGFYGSALNPSPLFDYSLNGLSSRYGDIVNRSTPLWGNSLYGLNRGLYSNSWNRSSLYDSLITKDSLYGLHSGLYGNSWNYQAPLTGSLYGLKLGLYDKALKRTDLGALYGHPLLNRGYGAYRGL